jgi:hypothetical protein
VVHTPTLESVERHDNKKREKNEEEEEFGRERFGFCSIKKYRKKKNANSQETMLLFQPAASAPAERLVNHESAAAKPVGTRIFWRWRALGRDAGGCWSPPTPSVISGRSFLFLVFIVGKIF